MLVKYWMTTDLVTVDEDLSLMKASVLMKENEIKHLPVVKQGRLVGIVSDRDLKEAQPSKATSLDIHELYYLLDQVKIKNLMTRHPHTTTPEEIVERAAALMLNYNISALPVVDGQGELRGIVTKGDLFEAMIVISGIHQGRLQLGVELEDRPGCVKDLTDLIRIYGGRIVSITTHDEDAPEGLKHLFIRCREVEDEQGLFTELEDRFKVLYRTHYKTD
jgi:acetoin utilization protein AcuB